MLRSHVRQGQVDYRGFKENRDLLKTYLELISNNAPNESWSQDEKLAYWINAYNAFTIDLILENYPIKSIKDILKGPNIPFIRSPWDLKFFRIGGKKMDLNDIEHSILRKEFNEPKVHFAIVCASKSCPKLRNEAYEPTRIESQLKEQAQDFINDPIKNIIETDQTTISKIFLWFGGDFKKDGSLISFLNHYTKQKISEETNIDFMDYDWSLNEAVHD